MQFIQSRWFLVLITLAVFGATAGASAAGALHPGSDVFPPALSSYEPSSAHGLLQTLRSRIAAEPFNLVASIIFLLAIIHTFLAPFFLKMAHRFEREHRQHLEQTRMGTTPREGKDAGKGKQVVSFKAEIFHLLGEVEAVFGMWVIPLLIALSLSKEWGVARDYVGGGVNYTEPLFVVVIMAIAASRPVLAFSERIMALAARAGGSTPAAWWFSILTIGPLLGSFITEPAAMTISALLLADKIYRYRPARSLAYATLGLLFVNVSVGGTLTHFAAPPVLMVASKWDWGFSHMLMNFGWKAAVGVLVANLAYFFVFRKEFKRLAGAVMEDTLELEHDKHDPRVPVWITLTHMLFLAWTVFNNHYPALFIGGFLCYLAFVKATNHHQSELSIKSPMLVGFFLAGLVVHGGLQGWWIEPVLSRLSEIPLYWGALVLTAFNDNAAITYLASLVPGFTPELKYAVVSGAVAGGGLTVIANAPNPAGQSILANFFPDGVSPLWLLLGALVPTVIMSLMFLLL